MLKIVGSVAQPVLTINLIIKRSQIDLYHWFVSVKESSLTHLEDALCFEIACAFSDEINSKKNHPSLLQ